MTHLVYSCSSILWCNFLKLLFTYIHLLNCIWENWLILASDINLGNYASIKCRIDVKTWKHITCRMVQRLRCPRQWRVLGLLRFTIQSGSCRSFCTSPGIQTLAAATSTNYGLVVIRSPNIIYYDFKLCYYSEDFANSEEFMHNFQHRWQEKSVCCLMLRWKLICISKNSQIHVYTCINMYLLNLFL